MSNRKRILIPIAIAIAATAGLIIGGLKAAESSAIRMVDNPTAPTSNVDPISPTEPETSTPLQSPPTEALIPAAEAKEVEQTNGSDTSQEADPQPEPPTPPATVTAYASRVEVVSPYTETYCDVSYSDGTTGSFHSRREMAVSDSQTSTTLVIYIAPCNDQLIGTVKP